MRICGDYKVTINPAIDIDQYPLPRPEDRFATLAGGKYLTTLDLSHAYNQLEVEAYNYAQYSEGIAVFTSSNGIRHTRSAPYHPATNGLAEHFVQSFKQGFKISQSSGLHINCGLSNYLFLYRSTPHSTTGVTPSSLFLKRKMRTRFNLLRPDREAEVSRKQERQKRDHDRHSSARQEIQ